MSHEANVRNQLCGRPMVNVRETSAPKQLDLDEIMEMNISHKKKIQLLRANGWHGAADAAEEQEQEDKEEARRLRRS